MYCSVGSKEKARLNRRMAGERQLLDKVVEQYNMLVPHGQLASRQPATAEEVSRASSHLDFPWAVEYTQGKYCLHTQEVFGWIAAVDAMP